MAENTQELELIRMLIAQNGESIQLLREVLKASKERDANNVELYKELMHLVQGTGALEFLAKKFREPDDATLEVEAPLEESEPIPELIEDVPPEAAGQRWDGPRKVA